MKIFKTLIIFFLIFFAVNCNKQSSEKAILVIHCGAGWISKGTISEELENDIEGKKIILIDDVLYTGRSVRSALSALDYYGRPSKIQLLVLIDRRFARHLPIQPDFSGRQVDAIQNEKVFVNLSADDNKNSVYIINETNE